MRGAVEKPQCRREGTFQKKGGLSEKKQTGNEDFFMKSKHVGSGF